MSEMSEIMGHFEAQGHPGFPRIIGIIDGTHIIIKAPLRQPDAYVNRKKFHSIVAQVRIIFFLVKLKIYCLGYCNLNCTKILDVTVVCGHK